MRGRPLSERFWEKVAIPIKEGLVDASPCWPWLAKSAVRGRGVISVGGVLCYAPRVAWALTYGPIPRGLNVLHKCDNPACVNPRHLFLGTQKDNVDDMRAKGRDNYRGGYTRELREAALHLRDEGRTYEQIGAELGIATTTAYRWVVAGCR